jgi:hypothetical protein
MAKSKTATAPEHAGKAGTTTLAGAIRQSLAELGIKADKGQVGDWIRKNHPSLTFKEATLSSSLSNVKKELRGNGGKAPSGRGRRARSAGEPTLTDLFRVKDLAEERGGVEQVRGQIDQVLELAGKVGGLERLQRCLSALKTLHG